METPNYVKNEILETIQGATVINVKNNQVLHIVVGDDDYNPSEDDLRNYSKLFLDTDEFDAVIATNYHKPISLEAKDKE